MATVFLNLLNDDWLIIYHNQSLEMQLSYLKLIHALRISCFTENYSEK